MELQQAHPEQRIELWFQDEARFGQQGTNSRVWARRASRPRAPRQTEYQWLYLFGAVCPASGQSNGWIMPQANAQTLQAQLDELGRSLASNVHALLVLDGAGWHHSSDLRVPGNLTLRYLPPYSPELNPAEMLWREMRQRHLSNRVFPDAAALDQAVTSAWLNLSSDLDRMRQLTDFDWIHCACQRAFVRPDTS